MAREMYPLDVPRGARIVREGIIVVDVALWRAEGGVPVVAVLGDDEMTRLYAHDEKIEVEEDTAARRARLEFAEKILSGEFIDPA